MEREQSAELAERERLREELVRVEHMLDTERNARVEAEALLGGLQRIAAAASIARFDEEILETVREVFHADAAALFVDGGQGVFEVEASTCAALEGSEWGPGPLLQRLLNGTPVAVFDVRSVPDWESQSEAAKTGVCSALHLPLLTQRRNAFVVAVHSTPAFFAPRHVDLARRFAKIIVPFLDGLDAKTIEHERQEAERRAELLERQRAMLEEQLATIREQRDEIQRLAAPAIQLWDHLLLVPIIGAFDAEQAEAATERVLSAMTAMKAKEVLLDLTGLERADEQLAARLDAITRAVRIMGGTSRLSGVSSKMGWSLARLDLEIAHRQTFATLRTALVHALGALGYEIRRV